MKSETNIRANQKIEQHRANDAVAVGRERALMNYYSIFGADCRQCDIKHRSMINA